MKKLKESSEGRRDLEGENNSHEGRGGQDIKGTQKNALLNNNKTIDIINKGNPPTGNNEYIKQQKESSSLKQTAERGGTSNIIPKVSKETNNRNKTQKNEKQLDNVAQNVIADSKEKPRNVSTILNNADRRQDTADRILKQKGEQHLPVHDLKPVVKQDHRQNADFKGNFDDESQKVKPADLTPNKGAQGGGHQVRVQSQLIQKQVVGAQGLESSSKLNYQNSNNLAEQRLQNIMQKKQQEKISSSSQNNKSSSLDDNLESENTSNQEDITDSESESYYETESEEEEKLQVKLKVSQNHHKNNTRNENLKKEEDDVDRTKAGSSNEVRDTHPISKDLGIGLKGASNILDTAKYQRSMTRAREDSKGIGEGSGQDTQFLQAQKQRRMTVIGEDKQISHTDTNSKFNKSNMDSVLQVQSYGIDSSSSPFNNPREANNNMILIEKLDQNSIGRSSPAGQLNSQYAVSPSPFQRNSGSSFALPDGQQSNADRSLSIGAKQGDLNLNLNGQDRRGLSPEQHEKIRQKRLASFVKLRTEIFKVTSSQGSVLDKRDTQSQAPYSQNKSFGALGSHGGSISDKKYDKNKRAPVAFHSITFGDKIESRKSMKEGNKVRTQRYTMFSWAPLSLLIQFKRVSNIYFLIISILTFMSFSPKNPLSMISTFVFVLIFTMIKEAYEDYQRYKSDKEMNNKLTKVLNPSNQQWEVKKWQFLAAGDIIRLDCDFEAPADIVLLHCSNRSGVVFVDTMNLDGETNLKERFALHEHLDERRLPFIQGEIKCDPPNENLERWESQINYRSQIFKQQSANIKNLLLRGCFVKNTEFAIGIVVYTGMNTKIMKNLKKPLYKVSNIMRLMNSMLYSVFAFQFLLISVFAGLDVKWINDNLVKHYYLNLDHTENSAKVYFTQLLVFWVAYSHMIPISLYVVIEILKLAQASFINKDVSMFDIETQTYSMSRNSDLIEELGQVEMVFSDKTGTLTQNKMIFKKCQINGVKYGELKPNERDNLEGMAVSGTKEIRDRVRYEYQYEKAKKAGDQTSVNTSTPAGIQGNDLPYVTMFFSSLSLCNTVMCDFDSSCRRGTGEIIYKAASPDELALVQGAKVAAIQMVSREHNRVTIYNSATKEQQVFKVVAEFPFDSLRKRMSVIVKEISTKQYKILCKGADSVMLDRIAFEKNGIEDLRSIVDEDLYTYSQEGLRTLIIASRSIKKEQYVQFKKIYRQLQASIGPNKEQQLFSLFDKMESNLRYIGCSAIEDKLQEGVSTTISKLMNADIRFFMLTGDKLETAIEIARSCQIIQENMFLLILGQTNREDVYRKMSKIQRKRSIDINEKVYSLKDLDLFNQVIAVEGATLTLLIEDQELQDLFFHIAIRSKSVVCCRMSPKQKADLVNIFKSRGPWITLAIGDGANDVSMIMEAHIGVGIKGKEGTQAVRSADFAISQFQFLLRLLIFQGRNGYSRVSSMICYYFYKNIVLVLTEFYFALYSGFSGQIFFLDWLPMLYNAVFTSWHCLFTLLLEKDVNYNYSFRYPQIYKSGQIYYYFNYTVFWKWIMQGLWHGAVCFFIPMYNAKRASTEAGTRDDHWVASTISFSMIIHLVIYKLLIEARHFNMISFAIGILCLLIYWSFLLLVQISDIGNLVQPQIVGVIRQMFQSSEFWLMLIGGPVICLIPDVFIQLTKQVFYPTPIDKVLFEQKYKDPNYDHIEHFNKVQKTLQMRKRRTALQSEHRKLLIAQRRTSFTKMLMVKNSSQVDFPADDQILIDLSEQPRALPNKMIRNQKHKGQTTSGVIFEESKNSPLSPLYGLQQMQNTSLNADQRQQSNVFPKQQPKSALKKPKEPSIQKVVTQEVEEYGLDATIRSDRPLIANKAEVLQAPISQDGNTKLVPLKDKKPEQPPAHTNKNTPTTIKQKQNLKQSGIKVTPLDDKTLPKLQNNLPPSQNDIKESSYNEISSASSFSGNRSQKAPSPKIRKEYKPDILESPRGSIKAPSPGKVSPPNHKQMESRLNEEKLEKPNNNQEDTPEVVPKIMINTKELNSNLNSPPVNLDFFKKIVGNRTPNFFQISNNNTIPKNQRLESPSDIQDMDEPSLYNAKAQKNIYKEKREKGKGAFSRLRTPTFPERSIDGGLNEQNQNHAQGNNLEPIQNFEVDISHPLEKQHRPSIQQHSKKKKYVEKYSKDTKEESKGKK